jgi:hypothetical protein
MSVYYAGRLRNLLVEFRPNDLTFYLLHRHACDAKEANAGLLATP